MESGEIKWNKINSSSPPHPPLKTNMKQKQIKTGNSNEHEIKLKKKANRAIVTAFVNESIF